MAWKLDRLGRTLSHLIRIVEELKAKGIAFPSLTEQMDTTTPHGEFLFNIFGALAQHERALIKERVMAGLPAGQARGLKAHATRRRGRKNGQADHRRVGQA